MKRKSVIYLVIIVSIVLIIVGGYLRIYYGNSYGLIFIGGITLLFLQYWGRDNS